MNSADPLLTYAEAAQLIGCSKRTLHRLINAGHIDPVRPLVGGPRIRRSDAARVSATESAA